MAKIYGEIDSLERLTSLFASEDIDFLSSIDEITLFEQNYESKIHEIKREVKNDFYLEVKKTKESVLALTKDYDEKLEKREKLLVKEKEDISKKIRKFSKKPKNIFEFFYYAYKRFILKRRKYVLSNHFEKEKKRPFIPLKKKITAEIKNIDYLEKNSDSLIEKRIDLKSETLRKAKNILDENSSLFAGAIGEQKAIDELEKLPDTFAVINNFHLKLNPPIYNKSTDDRIYSIQADHIVIGPSGVFLIETKNWSRNSIINNDFYSPVDQVKRSNFALFCYLNNSMNDGFLSLFRRDKKISIRNIILMVNAKLKEEFQYVKILNLSEVRGYITYFKPVLSREEMDQILECLLG